MEFWFFDPQVRLRINFSSAILIPQSSILQYGTLPRTVVLCINLRSGKS